MKSTLTRSQESKNGFSLFGKVKIMKNCLSAKFSTGDFFRIIRMEAVDRLTMTHFQLFPSFFSEITAWIEHCLRGDSLFSPCRGMGFSWLSIVSMRTFSIKEEIVLLSSLQIALSFLRVSSSVRNDIFVFFREVGISR